jgi:hypothetical protein
MFDYDFELQALLQLLGVLLTAAGRLCLSNMICLLIVTFTAYVT